MYKDIKKEALKRLLNNRKISEGLVFAYLILILLLHSNIRGSIIVYLLFYLLIFGLNIGGYNVFLKMAEKNEKIDGNFKDNFINAVFDRDYWSVFRKEWRPIWYIYIPLVIFYTALRIGAYSMRLGLRDKLTAVCLCVALVSAVIFVKCTVKYIFVPYILADRYAGNISADTEANRDTVYYNKRLIEGEYGSVLKFVLSFSGWFILSCLVSGFGFALLLPYFRETTALLYIKNRNKYQEKFLKNRS